jgi:hypothetical protein
LLLLPFPVLAGAITMLLTDRRLPDRSGSSRLTWRTLRTILAFASTGAGAEIIDRITAQAVVMLRRSAELVKPA